MSEPTPSKREKQPTVTEIDSEVYKRLCDVVKDETFQSISFRPWHKGCDTEFDTTSQWPDLQDVLENWYYDHMGDMDSHTFAEIVPHYDGENLIFVFSGYWDRGQDYDAAKNWDEEHFQKIVYDLLPAALKKKTCPESLWISLELDYASIKEILISGFSISLEGEDENELTTSITPRNQKVIRDYVTSWCFENHGPEHSFSISIENNAVSSVVTSCATEEYLLVPKKSEQTDS
jgi:hypothetical protein